MERLLTMDKEQFISEMQAEVRQILGRVADAVNNAPTGNVIGGGEIAVRDAMAELRQRVFAKAVQMRIDSTESSFSPSEGRDGHHRSAQGPRAAVEPGQRRITHGIGGDVPEQPVGLLLGQSTMQSKLTRRPDYWAHPMNPPLMPGCRIE